jgi:hypothetical protein
MLGEIREDKALIIVQPLARSGVEYAQGPQAKAGTRDERNARIEANPALRRDERVVPEARILARVGNDKRRTRLERVAAERDCAGRFGKSDTVA